MKPKDEQKPAEPAKPPTKPDSVLSAMTPEQRRKVEEFRKGLGERLAEGLNRAVMAEHERDVALYNEMKARGETPPGWLRHIVEQKK